MLRSTSEIRLAMRRVESETERQNRLLREENAALRRALREDRA